MATRSQNVLSLSFVGSLLLFVALVLVNAVFARASVRVDLTEDSLWTLTRGSKEVLGGLKDTASVKVFWKVPQSGDSEWDRRFLADLLSEMRSASNGMLEVRWVDLEDDDGKAEAEALGVSGRPLGSESGGEVTVSAEAYDTLVIEVGHERATVDSLFGRRDEYEYQIVSNLAQLSRTSPPVVGLWSPRPPFNPFGGGAAPGNFRAIEMYLENEYKTSFRSAVSLDEPVPDEVQVLVVAGPKDLEDKQIWNLEQFALRGGKLVLLPDPVNVEMADQFAMEPERSGLEDWLTHLGVTVEKAIAGDAASYLKELREEQRQLALRNQPYWPMIPGEFLSQSVPATRGFSGLPLYWPAPLHFDEEKGAATGRHATVLATTTPYGFTTTNVSQMRSLPSLKKEDLREVPLVLLVEGTLDSFWKGRDTPAETAAAQEKRDEEERKKREEEEKKAAAEPPKDAAPSVPEGDGKPAEPVPAEPVPAEPVPAEPVPAEPVPGEPKPEDAKPEEEPKAATPVPDEPKPAEPAPAEPAAPEEPKAGEPAPEAPKAEEPEPEEAKPAEPAPETPKADAPKLSRIDSGKVTIVVIGDAELVSDSAAYRIDRTMRQYGLGMGHGRGFDFLLNVVGWMAGNEALLELRARNDRPRTLEATEPGQQKLIQWANTLGMPILALFAGIVVFMVRRYQR